MTATREIEQKFTTNKKLYYMQLWVPDAAAAEMSIKFDDNLPGKLSIKNIIIIKKILNRYKNAEGIKLFESENSLVEYYDSFTPLPNRKKATLAILLNPENIKLRFDTELTLTDIKYLHELKNEEFHVCYLHTMESCAYRHIIDARTPEELESIIS